MEILSVNILEDSRIDLLFRQYYPRLCSYASRFVGKDLAHDIVMESFIKVWEKRHSIKDQSPASLLFVIVRNSCLNHIRTKRLTIVETIDYLRDIEGSETLYNLDFGFCGENKILYDELEDQIQIVMSELPPVCRSVFQKSRFEGKKNREIAEELNTSIKNVEKHITKALSAFSKHFQKKYPLDLFILIMSLISFDNIF